MLKPIPTAADIADRAAFLATCDQDEIADALEFLALADSTPGCGWAGEPAPVSAA